MAGFILETLVTLTLIGRLIINGRKKELIVSSGGDNISPQKIEDIFKEYLEIEHAIVYGDNIPSI